MNLVNLLKGLLNLQKKIDIKTLPSQGLFYKDDFEITIKKADVEDIIDGKYNLEVSSAGIERPLVKLQDFDRFKNYVAEIKLHHALNGAKKYECTIIGTEGQNIKVMLGKDEVVSIDFENIKDAKLVLTDELFKKIVKG